MFVPETTIKTEWIFQDTFISIPRQVSIYQQGSNGGYEIPNSTATIHFY